MGNDQDSLQGRVAALEMLLLLALDKTHSLEALEAEVERMIQNARKLNRDSHYIEALRDFLKVWTAGREP